ncbi:hypothetical protein SCLCIDRAFT_289557 [Scleroderma citrinum Foug A]|uniref:Uncharacterized protein n=1 Tax=Scleroderma citrinum Foug A TaxID=1036808 RepID=A0A0C2ZT07_9AGAM|nr:hypothetical protein SCLCIDRAFT_289557 [Scleroderma citrinum Foug A]
MISESWMGWVSCIHGCDAQHIRVTAMMATKLVASSPQPWANRRTTSMHWWRRSDCNRTVIAVHSSHLDVGWGDNVAQEEGSDFNSPVCLTTRGNGRYICITSTTFSS